MSHLEYVCPVCHATVMRSREPLEQTRPNEFYRCPDCWSSIHFRDLRRHDRLRIDDGQGGGAPFPISLTLKGTAVDESTGSSVTVANVGIGAGSRIIVCFAVNNAKIPSITWGSATFSPANLGSIGGTSGQFYSDPVAGGINNLTLSFTATAPTIKLVAALELSSGAAFYSGLAVQSGGDSVTDLLLNPISLSPPFSSDVVGILVSHTSGPTTDNVGSWITYSPVIVLGTSDKSPLTDNRMMRVAYVNIRGGSTVPFTDGGVVLSGLTARTTDSVTSFYQR